MRVLSVDLASKFSAATVLDGQGGVTGQFDSRGKSAIQLAEIIAKVASLSKADVIGIEDVPYGNLSQGQTKPVTRLQGVLIAELARVGCLDRTIFINPSTWQAFFWTVPKEIKGTGPRDKFRIEAAAKAALEWGYEPPDLIAKYIEANPGIKILKKDTNPLAKSMTDYVSAYLMGVWMQTHWDLEALLKLSGVQPPFI